MADPQQYTDAQLSDGTTLRFLGTLGPDEVRQKVQAYRLKQQISENPPQIQKPTQPNMQQVDFTGKPQNPNVAYTGPGAWANPDTAAKAGADPRYQAAVGIPTAAAATAMGGYSALPFLLPAAKSAIKALPVVAASEAINYARANLPGGKYIPPGAELLPWFLGGGEKGAKPAQASAERELAPSTDQMPGRPYKPNPRFEPQPEPEPLPPRSGPLLLKGEVQAPSPTPASKLPWVPQIEKALGNEPFQIKPGVPIKNQGVPRASTAVDSFSYDPDAQEFHVQPKGGSTGYIYGGVSQEDANAFANAESKGKAWQQMRNNPLVGKVVNGKRVAVKPAVSADQQNDLTDILTRSLQAVPPKQ